MKKVLCLFFALVFLFSVVPLADLKEDERPVFSADDYLGISDAIATDALAECALGAILMEAESGEVLFEHNPDERLPIASVTKVMTLLLTLEAIDEGRLKLDDIVTVSENAASMGGSQAFMEAGEKMSVDDMLKAVTVSSCNDGAVALAEHIAGSEGEFVKMMNSRAAELGMTSTDFINCTGLDDEGVHYSSARDVAIMSREVIKHPLVFDYTTIWMDSIRNGEFTLANTNKLIRFYDGATGLKTGSTSKARFCLSATAERNGVKLVAVVLGAPTSAERFAAAKGMLDYGFSNFSVYYPKTTELPPIKIWDGKKERIKAEIDVTPRLVKKGEEGKIEEEIKINKDIKAPIKKGDVLGKIYYKIGDNIAFEAEIKASESIEKADFFDVFFTLLRKVLYTS